MKRFKFIGYPSKYRNKKGKVISDSKHFPDMVNIEFDNGEKMLTEKRFISEIKNAK